MMKQTLKHQQQNHFNQIYRKVVVYTPISSTTENHNTTTLSSSTLTSPTNSSSNSTANSNLDFYFVHQRFEKSNHPKPNIQSVVFDMDGTLTIPCIDFAKMRLETGIKAPNDLLNVIHALKDEKEKARIFGIIDRIEEEANEKLEFQPHLFELLDELIKLNMKKGNDHTIPLTEKHFAVVTRNSEKSLQFFISKLGTKYSKIFTILLSRDFIPYKPNPGCLIHIAKSLNLPSTKNMLMVGDSFHDIACAKEAGAYSCLYTSEMDWTEKHTTCVEENDPDFICHDLRHVVNILNYISSL